MTKVEWACRDQGSKEKGGHWVDKGDETPSLKRTG